MIDVGIDNFISLTLVIILIVQYLAIVIVGMKMIRSGYNGIIRAIVTNRIMLSILLIEVMVSRFVTLPAEFLMLSLFALVGSNIYMHAALSTEAKRPIKNQSRSMRRIYSDLNKELPKEEVSNDDSN